MTRGTRTIRTAVLVALTASFVLLAAAVAPPAAAAAGTDPAEYEYDGADLLIDGPVTRSGGTVTLVLDDTAAETDTIRFELGADHADFEIAAVTDETPADVGIALENTGDAVTVELMDLSGATGGTTEIAVGVDLTATASVAGRAHEYDSTPVATVTTDETGSGLVGASVVSATVNPSAEVGFDADSIDNEIYGENLQIEKRDEFIISFSDDEVFVDDGDVINLSVNPSVIADGDGNAFNIKSAVEMHTKNSNISGLDITTSGDANVFDSYDDQISVKIKTADGNQKKVSGETIAVGIAFLVESDSMRSAAGRYRNTDLFTVDVEGEGNAELTDNDDVRTETPVVLDIYPGEPNGEGFDLGIDSGAEFGIGEGQSLSIDGLEDRHGNPIPTATVEFAVEGPEGRHVHEGVHTSTDGTPGITLDGSGALDVPLGVFDLSATVTDVPGPATPTGTTEAERTEAASGLVMYPDDVSVGTTTAYSDFDADGDATIEVAVDLGVPDEDIGRVDVELRRESGDGTLAFAPDSGSPTPTDPWETTGYDGDDRLGRANAWVIERDLTAEDFEDGVRRYVLDADSAARYDVAAAVMPREAAIDPDPSAVETSLSTDPGGANRDATRIVATGPIDRVSNVSIRGDREFVGTDTEEGGAVEIDLEGFEDAGGRAVTNTDEAVGVGFGGADAGTATPTPAEGSAAVAVDPTAIDSGTADVGEEAAVELGVAGGTQRVPTDITLVHRAIQRPDGAWRAASLSQPASVYVDADGRRDVVQWNPETESYEGLTADGTGDVIDADRIDHEDLHRGFYAYADGGVLRIGFEYVTTADGSIGTEDVELGPGWHLASSNYDVSSHPSRELAADANWVDGFDGGGFAVWNADRTERLHDGTAGIDVDGTSAPIGHDEAYWIEVDDNGSAPVRRVVSPTFSESDGGDE